MKQLQQIEASLNAYKVNFYSLLNQKLNREGYAYLFEGME